MRNELRFLLALAAVITVASALRVEKRNEAAEYPKPVIKTRARTMSHKGLKADPVNQLYFVYGAGVGYTAPAGFQLASLADWQSQDFIDYFNQGGLTEIPTDLGGCCVFNSSDGFLTYGGYNGGNPSYIAPYSQAGQHECAADVPSPVYLGTAYGAGQYPLQFFGANLTAATVAMFNVTSEFSEQLGCAGSTSTFAIYKQASGPTPPPTPPPTPSGPPYVIYGVGQSFPTPPPGYTLTGLADYTSAAFAAYYNANGLTDLQQQMDGCCIFNSTDGFILYDQSYLAPYTQGGTHQCLTQLQNPVYFGTAYDVGPDAGNFIGNFTPAVQAELTANPTLNPQLGCSGSVNFFGVYKNGAGPTPPSPPTPAPSGPPYVIYGAGQDFTVPPAGYTLMGLSDYTSAAFVAYYNANGLTDLQQQMDGCCVFNSTDGFIMFNQSYLAPFTITGQHQCVTMLSNPVAFGTQFYVGPIPDQFIGNLTQADLALLTAEPQLLPSLECGGSVNSFGVYKLAQ